MYFILIAIIVILALQLTVRETNYRTLNKILKGMEDMAFDVNQLIADVTEIKGHLEKTFNEIKDLQGGVDALNTKIAELEAIIAGGGQITQELVDLVASVKAQAQTVDELIPDLPPPA